MPHNLGVRIALVPGPGNGGLLCGLRDDGTAAGQPLQPAKYGPIYAWTDLTYMLNAAGVSWG